MNTTQELNFYTSITEGRKDQATTVFTALENYFDFSYIECIETGASQNIEDGCFGFYLGKVTESKNGKYHSVDIEESIVDKSKILFQKYLPNLNIEHHVQDSVEFLKSYKGNPNLVHLDSWDLDLTNPIQSMLHGWLEFEAIKDKMPSGSIIIIDDNFMKGTWVSWNYTFNGEIQKTDIIDINYDIIGKGALVYHWCMKENTDWDLIGDHYKTGTNIKIIIKKR